jgi:hypothetical protein
MKLLTFFLLVSAAWGQFATDNNLMYGVLPGQLSNNTIALSGTNLKLARIVTIKQTGTIAKAGFAFVTAPSQSINIRIETLSGSPGLPTGSLYGGGSSETIASPAAGWNVVTLGTPATCTVGDMVAIVVEWTSTAGSSVNLNTDPVSIGRQSSNAVYTASWAKNNGAAINAYLEYNGGVVHSGPAMSASNASTGPSTLASNTTPDESGNRWVFPAPMRISGAVLRFVTAAFAAAADIVVLVGSTESVCATPGGAEYNAVGQYIIPCSAPIIVPANTPVYITLRPTTTTGTYRDTKISAYSAAHRAVAWPNTYAVQRTNAGAWTEDTLSVSVLVLPLFDGHFIGIGGFSTVQ